MYQPYFKNFSLSPFDSLNLKDVYKSMNQSLFIKNLKEKIIIKKTKVKIKKVDSLNLSPSFIKIDIQGHEYDCILGSLKTIKKNLPIIMIEYDEKIIKNIYKVLKKLNYKKFFFRSNKNMLMEHKNENVFNIFFIHKTIINKINSELKVIFNDNN